MFTRLPELDTFAAFTKFAYIGKLNTVAIYIAKRYGIEHVLHQEMQKTT